MPEFYTNLKITVIPSGEPQFYTLMDAHNHWFAVVQLNGEFMPERQTEIMAMLAAAPEMLRALEHMVDCIDITAKDIDVMLNAINKAKGK